MNEKNYLSTQLQNDLKNIVYSRLPEIYFHKAANLIIQSFKFPKIFPKKIIHILFKLDFIKRKNDKNHVDICAIINDEIIGVMRAKYNKDTWTINTNCVDKLFSKEKPFLWIKIMLFLASEILKNTNTTIVSFSANQPAIARIGVKYAGKYGILINPIVNSRSIDASKHYYKISKINNNV